MKSVLVFDLDNTLYPASCRLFDQIDQKMSDYVAELLNVDLETAHKVQKQYFYDYGTTMIGLMREHDVCPHHFMDYVHDIDLSPIPKDESIEECLKTFEGQKYIFTNGSEKHANNILQYLGLDVHFDGVFDIIRSEFAPKPAYETYEKMMQSFGFYAKDAIMFEDIPRNLEPAAKLGMTTVWIASQTEYASMESLNGTDRSHYIHFQTDYLGRWLSQYGPGQFRNLPSPKKPVKQRIIS